jgi:hypothetical protein
LAPFGMPSTIRRLEQMAPQRQSPSELSPALSNREGGCRAGNLKHRRPSAIHTAIERRDSSREPTGRVGHPAPSRRRSSKASPASDGNSPSRSTADASICPWSRSEFTRPLCWRAWPDGIPAGPFV